MRALSIRQPWAWLIVAGFKPVENRTWSTDYRGPLLIHASKTCSLKSYFDVRAQMIEHDLVQHVIQMPKYEDLERGGVIGICNLVDVVTEHDSPYFVGPFGFVLADVRPVAFTEWKGGLSFFHVPTSALPPGAI